MKELAAEYEVTKRTMSSWLKPHRHAIGEQVARKFTPKQVEIIFNLLGIPPVIARKIDETVE